MLYLMMGGGAQYDGCMIVGDIRGFGGVGEDGVVTRM